MRDTLVRATPRRTRPRPTRPQLIKAAITTALVLFTLFALPQILSLYYVDTMTQVAVYSMVTLAPDAKVRTLTAGQRRLVEVARAVVGRPRLVLLDEPAAGLPDEETRHLGDVIRGIPEHTGALAILVDHDMSLVSACCATTAVLDFGKLIASGPTAAVLRDDAVIRAYLGVA